MRRPSTSGIENALKTAQGNIAAAARALNCTRLTIYRRIQANIKLQEVLEDTRQAMLDNAESALNRAVIQGEAWAVCFFLKTQGKSRGYVERSEIKAETKVALVSNPEELSDDELTIIATGGSLPAVKKTAGQKDAH